MKTIRQLAFALITALLLTAGFVKAAESFDVVSTSSQIEQVNQGLPGTSCGPPH